MVKIIKRIIRAIKRRKKLIRKNAWKFKKFFRRHGKVFILIMILMSALAFFSLRVEIPPDIPYQKPEVKTYLTWSEKKKIRLSWCLEELEEYRIECEVSQSFSSCNKWIKKSWDCEQWKSIQSMN